MRAGGAPVLADGDVIVRPIRVRDATALERELAVNRRWLRPWEATVPGGGGPVDVRSGIRALLRHARTGASLPFAIEVDGQLVGQLNVSSITAGSLSSATIGYWVAERFAGRGVTPTAVALVTDLLFIGMGVHRVEICIRPENAPSLRIVEKLGYRYEGLRRRYIHIDGGWRDHFAFALTVEDVPVGVLRRWKDGQVDPAVARVCDDDWAAAGLATRAPAGAPRPDDGATPIP
jgi:ribosomal-protein-alanine N-acetyltransferase